MPPSQEAPKKAPEQQKEVPKEQILDLIQKISKTHEQFKKTQATTETIEFKKGDDVYDLSLYNITNMYDQPTSQQLLIQHLRLTAHKYEKGRIKDKYVRSIEVDVAIPMYLNMETRKFEENSAGTFKITMRTYEDEENPVVVMASSKIENGRYSAANTKLLAQKTDEILDMYISSASKLKTKEEDKKTAEGWEDAKKLGEKMDAVRKKEPHVNTKKITEDVNKF